MSRKLGITLVVTGVLLILSAILLCVYNLYDDYRAGQESESLLSEVKKIIRLGADDAAEATEKNTDHKNQNSGSKTAAGPDGGNPDTPSDAVTETEAERPKSHVYGFNYLGYLEIPALELELPVIDGWDYERLKYAPCRHSGSAEEHNLVIAGHNYKNHFGYLYKLKPGDKVIFFDLSGNEHSYKVHQKTVVDSLDVDQVLNSGCGMVLYTCTKSGETRLAVFLDETE